MICSDQQGDAQQGFQLIGDHTSYTDFNEQVHLPEIEALCQGIVTL